MIIKFDNVSYNISNKQILENISFSLESGDFLTIMGECGSGKSTLIKIFNRIIKTDNSIYIDDKLISDENIKEIRSKMFYINSNIDKMFFCDYVYDELAFSLENLCFEKEVIKENINKVSKELGIENLLEKRIEELSYGQKTTVMCAVLLTLNPSIIIFDELLSTLDNVSKTNLMDILKSKLSKESIIINITHDVEDVLFGNKILLLDKGTNKAFGEINEVYKDTKSFEESNIEIPFIAKLSKLLLYYDLIDEIYLKEDELINKLWP